MQSISLKGVTKAVVITALGLKFVGSSARGLLVSGFRSRSWIVEGFCIDIIFCKNEV